VSYLIPAFLAAVALLDGALAGFRAAAGRNALIRKTRYNVISGLRGACCSSLLLLVIGAGLGGYLAAGQHPRAQFAGLLAAGGRMSLVYLPYAVVVLVSLAGYFTFPTRASSWTILVGLGPLTVVRPAIAIGGGAAAVWHSHGLAAAVTAVAAVAGVLAVEPVVHRRWYRGPEPCPVAADPVTLADAEARPIDGRSR
jgi:hypothetical protein